MRDGRLIAEGGDEMMSRCLLYCALALAATTSASASPIWHPPHVATGSHTVWWDGASWDGPGQGVGALLGPMEWWGESGGPASVLLLAGTYSVDVLYEITALPHDNALLALPGGVMVPASAGPGWQTTVTAQTDWTPAYVDPMRGISWTGLAQPDQFVLFRSNAAYYLGIEDLAGTYGQDTDRDYNDLVVRLERVPEPVPVVLLLIGMMCWARLVVQQ